MEIFRQQQPTNQPHDERRDMDRTKERPTQVKVTLRNGNTVTSDYITRYDGDQDNPYIEFKAGMMPYYLKTKGDLAAGIIRKVEIRFPSFTKVYEPES